MGGALSIKVMSRVWELDLLSSDKFILLAFADHADDSGFCYPSLHRIAWKCGVSKDTIRRCLARMAFKGIIEVLSRGDGRGHTTRYRIVTEKGSTLPPFAAEGWHCERQRVANPRIKGGTAMLPESSLEPSMNRKPRAQSRSARNRFDEELEQRRKLNAKEKRLCRESDIRRELLVGSGPRD